MKKQIIPAVARRSRGAVFGRLFACLTITCLALPAAALNLVAQPPDVRYTVERESCGVPVSVYAARRALLLEQMRDSSAAFFFSADVRNRQNDVDFEYRQSSDMLYLTGTNDPGMVLVLVKNGIAARADGDPVDELLFVGEQDPRDALWHGPTLGLEAAAAVSGVHTASLDVYGDFMQRLLAQVNTVYVSQWPTTFIQNPLFLSRTYMENQVRDYFDAKYPQVRLRSLRDELNAMREIKEPEEVVLLRAAIDRTLEGFRQTLHRAEPGMWEYQLETVMESAFFMQGAQAVGYPSIVGSGPNACILHYIDNRRQTKDGELVLMDCGAEYCGYTADITRTFPVNGVFSPEQRQLYDLVIEAQDSVFALCRPGMPWSELFTTCRRVLGNGLLRLGVTRSFDEVSWYFPHGVSHRLGLDVHDVSSSSWLVPGFVFTVEPGIYVPQGSPCDERWWNIGIRVEDNVLITDDGVEILSADLPRRADEIEALMRE